MTTPYLTAKQARFYVYRLVDPRDSSAFYIGKGTGRRYAMHERTPVNSLIAERVESLRRAGLRYRPEIVVGELSEDEAFRVERELIRAEKPPCNIGPGRRSSKERNQEECRAAIRQFVPFSKWVRRTPRSDAEKAMYKAILRELALGVADSPRWYGA